MMLDRPLAFIDLETTDPDPVSCAIFEYGVRILLPNGKRQRGSMRFKPWKPITAEAMEVTGVTNEMVANCPPFAEYVERLWGSLRGVDLAGYNINRFDKVCLDQEIRRATNGNLRLDLTGVRVIDVQVLYFKKDPRSLSDAVRKYCGREHDGAHGAGDDAAATLDVMMGQLAAYPDLDAMTLDELARFSLMLEDGKTPADIAGKLYRDKDGELVYAFGKNKGVRVRDEPSYADWMLKPSSSFPGSTHDVLKDELAKFREERKRERKTVANQQQELGAPPFAPTD